MPDFPPRQALLSTQVTDARYFFLGLADEGRPGLMPAYGGFERCNPDYVVLRDTPGFASMELIVGGRGSVLLNGTATPLRAGLLFYYDTRTRLEIRTDPAQPLAKYFLCFHGRSVNRRLAAAGLRPGGLVQLAMFTEVQRLWDELIREGAHHRPTAGRLCAALTEVLLLKIEELAGLSVSPGRATEEAFLRCKGLIEARAASLATLADITRATGVGPTRLSRLFRRYQGLSPYQFLLHRKMALAAELLMNPATLVKEAAAQVGFADPYHFSRCFKQVHRVAPKDFQRSLKQV